MCSTHSLTRKNHRFLKPLTAPVLQCSLTGNNTIEQGMRYTWDPFITRTYIIEHVPYTLCISRSTV
jgi:hypothetical protein